MSRPRIDPNAHAQKLALARERAAEIKARRSAVDDGYVAPAPFQARPAPASTYPSQRPPEAAYEPPAAYEPAPPRAYDLGRGQRSDGASVGANAGVRPAYRSMVNYGDSQPATVNPYAAPSYDASYDRYGAPALPVAAPPPARAPYAPPSASAREAEDSFHSMLRSDGGSRARGRRPEWTSDYAPEEGGGAPAPAAAAAVPSGPLSTKQRLALMRDDLTGAPGAGVDPRVAREYGGLLPPVAPAQPQLTAAQLAYQASERLLGGSSGGGGGMGGGGASSFADAFPQRGTAASLSRTGLKPSGRKVQPVAAAAGGGYAAQEEASLRGAAAPRPPPSPPLPAQKTAAAAAYGNDDEPIGGGARRSALPAFAPIDAGPDSLPPGASASPRNRPQPRARMPMGGGEGNATSVGNQDTREGGGGKLALLKAKLRTGSASARSSRSGSINNSGSAADEGEGEAASYPAAASSGGGGGSWQRQAQVGLGVANSTLRGAAAQGYGQGARPPAVAPSMLAPPAAPVRGGYGRPASFDQEEGEEEEEEEEEEGGGDGNGPSEQADGNVVLHACRQCGRKFNEKALRVHERVCGKVFKTKRKAFDSKAHIVPPEAAQVAAASGGAGKGGPKGGKGKKVAEEHAGGGKTAWEAKSGALREAMRAAREYKAVLASGADPRTTPMPVSAVDPSLVPCPHCARTFSATAADRHIPHCANTRAKVRSSTVAPLSRSVSHSPCPAAYGPTEGCGRGRGRERCAQALGDGGGCTRAASCAALLRPPEPRAAGTKRTDGCLWLAAGPA